ncbi:hypothetical protein [Streptomyces sp. HNM0574]|uniref:hypothetical protein n=1 Tax=Streptomyces sp. HNM0574 TaxID=2714954 RepID=UPI00146A9BC8|nr:hypothetical protein [Streptomyces sp. HNM0574]NLU66576.1 hypothetical protein [Streptomyces sp. HNM0574]
MTAELAAAQRLLDDLTRSVCRLEQRVGSGLEVRRLRSDTEHLRESLSLLRAASPEDPDRPAPPTPEMVAIPDQPYDYALWADADDEGLGSRDRRAP